MAQLAEYDYLLPEERIAQTPLEDRSASRMLHLAKDSGVVNDLNFIDLPSLLQPGDLLVLNDTRVTARKLYGVRETGGAVEALLLDRIAPGRYDALTKPAKRLKEDTSIEFGPLKARVVEVREEGHRVLQFDPSPNLETILDLVGQVPLPPYIHERLADADRYQTVLAKAGGSAAAPTAALHFTLEILDQLRNRGISVATVTLSVGIDTFRPILVDDVSEHSMHGERCSVPEETASLIARCKGRVIAVGTTTVRTLETFAVGWRELEVGERVSKLFIQPGYEFKVVDGMLTNFHLPRTTMLLMISALAGKEEVLRAYRHAVDAKYRFLSFGDSMLIL